MALPLKKRLKRWLVLAFAGGLIRALPRLPRRAARGLFGRLGWLAFRCLRRDRRQVLANLQLAYPAVPAGERQRLAARVFVEVAQNAAEVVRMCGRDPRELLEWVDIEGGEHLEAARRAGRGAVCVTGHLGAWELLAGTFAQRGSEVMVLARPLKDARFERLLAGLRRRLGVTVVHESDGMRQVIRGLRRGALLGVLIDQNRVAKGTWLPFFGRPAYTAVGVAELARLGRCALVPMAIQRFGDRHRIRVHPPCEPDWSAPGAQVEAVGACTGALESSIRETPAQWAWMYDRWGVPKGYAAVAHPAPASGSQESVNAHG